MKLVLDNAFAVLACLSLGVLLLPPKYASVRIVVGALDVLYAAILLISSFSGSASA